MMQQPTHVTLDLVTLDEPPTAPGDVIEFLLDLADDAGRLTDRAQARRALADRRAESSFGMGLGVAIPHARTDAVTTPTVAFARSEAGIDFDAPDDEPAHLILLILVPRDARDEHLDVLTSLSRSLVDDDFRTALLDAADTATVVDRLQEAIP